MRKISYISVGCLPKSLIGIKQIPLNCPTDAEEIAERYAMAKLGGEDLERFEQHLIVCPRCKELVRQAREYVEAVKSAGLDLDSA